MPTLGPTELILILVIIVIFFGVGRLPEVFGAVGKGLREFRKNATDETKNSERSVADEDEEEKVAKSTE
jgi:sec-independent protein translocase protein TatA